MNPITHFLTGWVTANTIPSLTRRERAFVTWASVIPDLDGLGIVAEILTRHAEHPLNWWSNYHHVLGHNLGFALFTAALFGWLAQHKIQTAALVFVSFHLHLLCDLIGARGPDGDQWPIPYLAPFSGALQLSWTGQWALNAWQNIFLTAVLIGISCELARRRGFSPLEIFSKKADTIFVEVLRRRADQFVHANNQDRTKPS